MNLYIDARALQMPRWQGQQFHIYHILDQMIRLGTEHTFHLHFGWRDWNPQIDTLLAQPHVVCHNHPGKIWSHASLPFAILRSRSRLYYRMYNDDQRMRVAVPCPLAAHILDNGRHIHPAFYGVRDAAALRKYTQGHIHSFDLISTLTETVKHEIIDLFGIPDDRIVVAPCAVDLPDPKAPEERPALLPEGAPFFLMVNPGAANKNWQDALAAFALYMAAHPDDPDTLLVLAGNLRAETERISRALAAQPALACRVLCTGYVSPAVMRYLYRHARLSLFPSRYEGFGIPSLEAMAYDLPVIVSDIPVLQEVAGDAALQVPLDQPEALAEAMHRLNTDPDLRSTLIARGRVRVSAYSWRESGRITLEALLALGCGH